VGVGVGVSVWVCVCVCVCVCVYIYIHTYRMALLPSGRGVLTSSLRASIRFQNSQKSSI
jgi:hypothetical protein